MDYANNELDLIDHILYRHKIYDIELEYDKDNNIIAKDDSNVWVGKAFYDFLYNEVFVFNEEGTLDLVADEDLKKLDEFRKKYEVDKENIKTEEMEEIEK